MKKSVLFAALAAAVSIGTVHAQTPEARALATQPQCFTAGDSIVVRGAVVFDGTFEPAVGARVRVEAGGQSALSTPTGPDGHYTAVIADVPDTPHAEVREVATYYGNEQTGSLLRLMAAQSFGGLCRASVVRLGQPGKVE